MTEKRKTSTRTGRDDPLWNSVASFGLDDIFVLPEWISELKGDKITSVTSGSIPLELAALVSRVGDCRGCRLCEERNTIVFSGGNPSAGIVFIGEGPYANFG